MFKLNRLSLVHQIALAASIVSILIFSGLIAFTTYFTERAALAKTEEELNHQIRGIVRMLDLALGVPDHAGVKLFLVAPDAREDDVRQQLARPAFRRVADLSVRFLAPFENRSKLWQGNQQS